MKKILLLMLFLVISLFLAGCIKEEEKEKTHTEGLEFELIEGEDAYMVTKYTGDSSEVYIDSHYNSLPVIKIERDVFLGMEFITSIELPDTIEELGMYCFMHTSIPKQITVPDKVYYFGASYDIDAELSVSENHIYHKQKMVDGVNTIMTKDEKELIFVNRRHLNRINRDSKTFNIPSTITKIGDFAMFYSDFTKIIVPDHVTDIGIRAFTYSDSEVNIPTQIVSIGESAYADCRFEGELILPEGLEVIGSWAFSINEINAFIFPSTLKSLGYGVFSSSPTKDKSNNVTTITFKSWNINEEDKLRFQTFILYTYRDTLIEEITVILPENEDEAADLKEHLEESLGIAVDSIEKSVRIKAIIYG